MGNFYMLPSDIILDILSRLPVELVMECKLVSKQWRNLVRRPSFSQIHLNHLESGKSSFIFCCQEKQRGPKEFYYSEYDDNCHEAPFHRRTRLNLNPPFEDYSLISSCNGLICFNSWLRDEISGRLHIGPAYICNPITREYLMLPRSNEDFCWSGFDFIPLTNEYKVVRMMYGLIGEPNIGIVQVYTLGSATGWRDVGIMDIIDVNHVRYGTGVFANGSLHWWNAKGTIILAFDLVDEKFSEIPPPPPCLTGAAIQLAVLGDNLSATHYRKADGCEIWLLKKNKDNNDLSWIKEFVTDIQIELPFDITKSGRLMCFDYVAKVYTYDPKASFSKMNVGFGKSISQIIRHKNTFVSLKALGEDDTDIMGSGERASSEEEAENKESSVEETENSESSGEEIEYCESSGEETENDDN